MDQWKVLRVVSNMLEAQLMKGLLESAGIPVFLRYETIGQIYALTVDGLGEIMVLVPAECWDEAEALLSPSPMGRDEDI